MLKKLTRQKAGGWANADITDKGGRRGLGNADIG